MRIVLFSDAYLPEGLFNHTKMLHELALELLHRGHKVVVITPGIANQSKALEKIYIDKVEVWKFRSQPLRGVSLARRAINETLLSWYAIRALKTHSLDTTFDLVINYSPTIFLGLLARWFRKKGAFVYLILRDFFPKWIIDEGMIKENSLAAKYFRFFEKLNYRSSNIIAVQSPANVPIFKSMTGTSTYVVDVLYNWASTINKSDPNFGKEFLQHHALSKKFIFFYGGNIGYAQDISYILKLAEFLIYKKNVHFLIIGHGHKFEVIKQLIKSKKLTNTTLASSISQENYRSILSQVNVGLFTLSKSHQAHNYPGKILGYFVAGLPILGAVNSGNDLLNFINESVTGLVSENGNFKKFTTDALTLINEEELREQMKKNGKKMLKETFSVQKAADQILKSVSN